jgi:2-haloacid dehalogenase
MSHTIVFDVNETLLDLRALDSHFQRIFGDAAARPAWFSQTLQLSLVATIVESYSDFATLASAALEMVAARRGTTLTPADRQSILEGLRTLPPHADVQPALKRLRQAGFRLATLTNNPPHVVEAQLQNARLAQYFERMLSVEAVQRFKPATAVYHMAASEIGVAPSDMWLVAAHDWDVWGALHAGCRGAFVARPGAVLNGLMPRPEIVGADLAEVAEHLIQFKEHG